MNAAQTSLRSPSRVGRLTVCADHWQHADAAVESDREGAVAQNINQGTVRKEAIAGAHLICASIWANCAPELGFSQLRQVIILLGGLLFGPLALLILYRAMNENRSVPTTLPPPSPLAYHTPTAFGTAQARVVWDRPRGWFPTLPSPTALSAGRSVADAVPCSDARARLAEGTSWRRRLRRSIWS
jgi:hypothetical protein